MHLLGEEVIGRGQRVDGNQMVPSDTTVLFLDAIALFLSTFIYMPSHLAQPKTNAVLAQVCTMSRLNLRWLRGM